MAGVVGHIGCRVRVKCIAWLDVISSLIACIVFGVAVYLCVKLLQGHSDAQTEHLKKNLPESVNEDLIVGIVVIFTILLLGHLIELCIAWKLLSATEPTMPIPFAIGRARLWRNYNIVLLILTLLSACMSSGGGQYAGSSGFGFFVVRLVCVIIVHRFIRNLEYASIAAPVAVVTMGQPTYLR